MAYKGADEKARLINAKNVAESNDEEQSQTYLGKRKRDDQPVINQDSFWAEVADLARTVTEHSTIAKEACEQLSLKLEGTCLMVNTGFLQETEEMASSVKSKMASDR